MTLMVAYAAINLLAVASSEQPLGGQRLTGGLAAMNFNAFKWRA